MLEKGLKCRLRGPYDPHENCRPIRAQDSGSHGSKGSLTTPNRLTRSLDTRRIDKETRGGLPEQGGRLGPPGSRPTTKHPRPSPLIRSFLTPSLRSFLVPGLEKLGAWSPASSPYKFERGAKNRTSTSKHSSPFSHLSSSRLVELRWSSCWVTGHASKNRYGFATSSLL